MKNLGFYWHLLTVDGWKDYPLGYVSNGWSNLDLTHDSSMTSSKCDMNLETAEELLVVCIPFLSWTDFPNFREICYMTWHGENYGSRCPIWVQVIIQSQHHLQMVFSMISMYSLGCPRSNSDHLRIISCFVRWQLLTLGNRDNQMYSSLYGKKQVLHLCTFFFQFHGVVEHNTNDISIIHIFFYMDVVSENKGYPKMDGLSWNTLLEWDDLGGCFPLFLETPIYKDTKPYTPRSHANFFSPKKKTNRSWSWSRKFHPRLQEVRSKDLFLQQVLVKEAVWIPRRDLKICVPSFFPTKKKQLHHPTQGVILEMLSFFSNIPKGFVFWVELGSLANFKFLLKLPEDLKHEEKLEDDCFGESESELFFFKWSWNPTQPFMLMDGNFQAFPI